MSAVLAVATLGAGFVACSKCTGAAAFASETNSSAFATMPPILRTRTYKRQQQEHGVFYPSARVTPEPDGRQPFFFVTDVRRRGVPPLTAQMLRVVRNVELELQPRYKRLLAFMFESFYDKQYFVLFLNGEPQFPALNFCYADKHCRHECPMYVNPVTHHVMISTLHRCADDSPVWIKSSRTLRQF